MRPVECKICKHTFNNEEDNKINVVCPECNIQYCNKNKTERFLFLQQDIYIEKKYTKDQFIHKIYNTLVEYIKSMILKNFRNRLKESYDLEDYSTQVAHYFLIYYLQDDDFIIVDSFSGMIFHKIRQALNEKSIHIVDDVSINYTFEDDSVVTYEDTTVDCIQEIEKYENRLYLLEYLRKLIFMFEGQCNCKRENFLRLMALHHYFKFGEKKVDNLFKNYGTYGRVKYDETIALLHKELLRLHSEKD